MLNRTQYRAYLRKNKKNKNLSICPKCNHKSLFYSTARGENDTVIKCDVCKDIVFEGPDVTRMVPPGIYLPLPQLVTKNHIMNNSSKPSINSPI